MVKHVLNIEKSRDLYAAHSDFFHKDDCYFNVFRALRFEPEAFKSARWKVAYGYVWVRDNLLTRHCFIVNDVGEVIDPTLFAISACDDVVSDPRSRIYYTMLVFDGVADYLNALIAEDGRPVLSLFLRNSDKQARKWARENGFILRNGMAFNGW